MKRPIAVVVAAMAVLLVATPARANGLRIDTGKVQSAAESKTVRVDARVTWKNGWRNSRNYDAVWVVVKLRVPQGAPQGSCSVSKDQVGAFCFPSASHRGDVAWQLTFDVEPIGLAETDVKAGAAEALVFGVEMVHIPAGPFSIGDPDPKFADAR